MQRLKAYLALEDGVMFEGRAFGAEGEACGEVVFNTSMIGYQEILTDPSYRGQIVTMTYPLIGNYGINPEDYESARPQVEGLVVREYSSYPSNWRSNETLENFLRRNGIVGIEGIDTRALTRHLRTFGSRKGVISTIEDNPEHRIEKARLSRGVVGVDLVKEVTCQQEYHWTEGLYLRGESQRNLGDRTQPLQVTVVDFGIKYSILRRLVDVGCKVTVVPAFTTADKILEGKPDGVLLSNGPGDPEPVTYGIDTVRHLLGKIPIFGICLGHQILGLALGGRTYKLKFGHHGGNHPVMNLNTRKVEITAQNHGFAVDIDSLPPGQVEITHINLNDRTLEGMRFLQVPILSIQYHPEASPGPHDAGYLFGNFVQMMEDYRQVKPK
jgi:carbamoyl-phosphate synthase small subunit